jgi:hypothetical protein
LAPCRALSAIESGNAIGDLRFALKETGNYAGLTA